MLSDGRVVELCPNGDALDLCFENRDEFARLVCQARLRESAPQIAAMRRGLCAVIPQPVVRMWTVAELEQAICGSPEIPVAAIRDSARFETG